MVMYRQNETIKELLHKIMTHETPMGLDIESDCDEADHLLWSVSDESDMKALHEAFHSVESLYIADGHHRTAAACR